MRSRHIWTEEEVRILKEFYASESFVDELAAALGLRRAQIYNKAQQLGLRKPESYHSIAGKIGAAHPDAVAHQIKPGHIPLNKGKKMSPELYAKCAPTMFKKGQPSINRREVGSERVNVDGYIEIKVAEPNKWKLKHRVIWEKAHGKIPKSCNIQFKDGNPLNCVLKNLYIISRSEQMRTKNSMYARYPQELIGVIRLRGSVKRQITLHNKKLTAKENE